MLRQPLFSHETLSIQRAVPPPVTNEYGPCFATAMAPSMRADHSFVPVGDWSQLTVSDGVSLPFRFGPRTLAIGAPSDCALLHNETSRPCIGVPSDERSKVWS